MPKDIYMNAGLSLSEDQIVGRRVGIGTTSPQQKLHVGDGTSNNFIYVQQNNDGLYIGKSNKAQFGQTETNVIKSSGGSRKLAIGADDNGGDAGLYLGVGSSNDPLMSFETDKISFFNSNPIEQQTRPGDLNGLLDILENYGLLKP